MPDILRNRPSWEPIATVAILIAAAVGLVALGDPTLAATIAGGALGYIARAPKDGAK